MSDEKKEKPRRQKGTGSIYQRSSDGMWCTTIELPPRDGKRRRKTIVRAKQGDVEKALREQLRELTRAGDMPTSAPTLSQWCDTWWTRYGLTSLKVSTRPSYRSKIEQYIKPSIGRTRLDRLSVDHIHRMHSYIVDTKGLSPASAKRAQAVLSSILREAEREGLLSRNVAQIAAKPKTRKVEVDYLASADARLLLSTCQHVPYELARWGVSFLAGLRQSEALGLTWDMVNVEQGTITVAWQLKRLKWEHGCGDEPCGKKTGGGCPKRHIPIPEDQEARQVKGGLWLLRPKTSTSWREFSIPPLLLQILAAHMKQAGPGGEHRLVFHQDGSPVDHRDDSAMWNARLSMAQLRKVDGHSARHTCNTILTELGVDTDVRQAILGHSSDAVNAIYVHTSDTRVLTALDGVAGILDWQSA